MLAITKNAKENLSKIIMKVKENNLPIIVFNMNTSGNLLKLVKGDKKINYSLIPMDNKLSIFDNNLFNISIIISVDK